MGGPNQKREPGDLPARLRSNSLAILGGFHPGSEYFEWPDIGTVLLLGPAEPAYWNNFRQSPEYRDQRADPMDRWSKRIISALAEDVGAVPLFPFGDEPHQPFIEWAIKSGRAWISPVGLLVHDTAGLMLSYRGALAFRDVLDLPDGGSQPCGTCVKQPCQTACPVDALNAQGYDIQRCHDYLDTKAGSGCMHLGCAVRRACPVSQTFGRSPGQSEFHMRAFHP